MDEFEVRSHFPGLRNYEVPVRGTDVLCTIGRLDKSPDRWTYTLWTAQDELISYGTLDMSGTETNPEQIARIAYLCDVEYAAPEYAGYAGTAEP